MTALKQWRKRLGITQHEAAIMLGVSPPTYHKWEHERRPDGSHFDAPLVALLAAAAIESQLTPIRG